MQIGVVVRAAMSRHRSEVVRRRRILEPEQWQVLERTREPQRVGRRVAPVEVEGDVGAAGDCVDRRPRERELPLELRCRDRSRVQILVLEQRQVEVELQRREAAIGHLGGTSRVGVRRVHVAQVLRRPVHLRLRLGRLVERLAHPRQPARDERRAVARERVAGVAVRIDAHALAEAAAEELPEWHLQRARGEVPERSPRCLRSRGIPCRRSRRVQWRGAAGGRAARPAAHRAPPGAARARGSSPRGRARRTPRPSRGRPRHSRRGRSSSRSSPRGRRS